MTAVADALQADIEGISQPRAVVVGIMAGEGVQIGVLLDCQRACLGDDRTATESGQ